MRRLRCAQTGWSRRHTQRRFPLLPETAWAALPRHGAHMGPSLAASSLSRSLSSHLARMSLGAYKRWQCGHTFATSRQSEDEGHCTKNSEAHVHGPAPQFPADCSLPLSPSFQGPVLSFSSSCRCTGACLGFWLSFI